MRVLIISTMEGSPWGGSEELWAGVADILLSRSCDVTICIKQWPDEHPTARALRQRGAKFQYRKDGSLGRRVLNKLLDRCRNPFQALIKKCRPQLVMFSLGSTVSGLPWMEACGDLAVPYVTVAHGAAPWWWPSDEEVSRLRNAYSKALTACFVSAGNLSMTEQQLGVKIENAKIIRNPFKVPHEPNLSWPNSQIARWAFVSRVDAWAKGFDILLDVISQQKWQQRPLKITVFGSGPNANWLKESITLLGLNNIEHGGVSNPLDIWKKHQCLILPSRAEGMPLVVVEAMLCARPCIVTDVAGNTELVENNINGFVAEHPTAKALDAAMEAAWINRDNWEQMGKAAAVSVRHAIPPRPAEVFVNEILQIPSTIPPDRLSNHVV